MSTSFITPGHVRAFQAVTTQLYDEVTLASCLINGKPGVAILLVEHVGEGIATHDTRSKLLRRFG